MVILRIEPVVYESQTWGECSRFFTDFGLEPVPAGDGLVTVFRTQAGREIEIRPDDDPELPVVLEPGSTVRELIWGIDAQAALDALAAGLAREVRRDPDGSLHTVDETGYGLGFRPAAVTEPGTNGSADNTHGPPAGGTSRWSRWVRCGRCGCATWR